MQGNGARIGLSAKPPPMPDGSSWNTANESLSAADARLCCSQTSKCCRGGIHLPILHAWPASNAALLFPLPAGAAQGAVRQGLISVRLVNSRWSVEVDSMKNAIAVVALLAALGFALREAQASGCAVPNPNGTPAWQWSRDCPDPMIGQEICLRLDLYGNPVVLRCSPLEQCIPACMNIAQCGPSGCYEPCKRLCAAE